MARFRYDRPAGELGVEISRILVETGALTLMRNAMFFRRAGTLSTGSLALTWTKRGRKNAGSDRAAWIGARGCLMLRVR